MSKKVEIFSSESNLGDSSLSPETGIVEKTTLAPPTSKGLFGRFIDSYRRMEDDIDPSLSAAEKAEILKFRNEGEKLNKSISTRHMLMISMATGIGTGLLVGSGGSLNKGGPAGLLIGVLIVGAMLVNVMEAAGEMAVAYSDLSGGFNAYTSFLIDSSFAFSVSWNYCIQWLCVMPLELVTASMTIKYWTTSINPDAFIAIFYTLIVVINFYGSAGYGEAEFFFNTAKVLMLTGFIILSIIIAVGGTGNGYIGAKYWHDPGAFANSFKGVCAVLVNAAFSLGCTESLALTAAEQANPRRTIPAATKQVIYRIVFLFVIPLFMVGLLVPYNASRLLGAPGSAKTNASPFVIAVSTVRVVPHMVNAVILLAVLSVGNSALYCSSRTLLALSEQGFAPSWFNYIDRQGRPTRCLLVSAILGIFSFIAAYKKEEEVFNWLLSLSGLSQILTWSGIVLSHIRFRAAITAQGQSLNDLGYLSKTGVIGSWFAFIINILILVAQFWIALWPIGGDGKPNAENFFQNYLGMCVAIVFYIGHKIWIKNWRLFTKAEDIDLVRGRKFFDADVLAQEDAEQKEYIKNSPVHVRIYRFFC